VRPEGNPRHRGRRRRTLPASPRSVKTPARRGRPRQRQRPGQSGHDHLGLGSRTAVELEHLRAGLARISPA
jgi:hypothetical protein